MSQGRYDGRGIGDGRAGRDGRGGAGQSGRSAGYTSIPKSIKYGICEETDGRGRSDGQCGAGISDCGNGIMTGEVVYYKGNGYSSKPNTIKMSLWKELDGHALDYDGHDAAGKVRIPMEKVQQFVGITYGYPVRGVSILCFLLTIALILFSFSQVFVTSVCGTLDKALNLSSPYSLATEMGNLATKTTTTSSCLAQESEEALATETMFITTPSCLAQESGEALATA